MLDFYVILWMTWDDSQNHCGPVWARGETGERQEEGVAPQLRFTAPRVAAQRDLLRLAQRRHCHGIQTEPVFGLWRPEKNFWVFKATVYKSAKCRGFVGYGDAHPGNVSPLIFNHAEMRMAETRAVNRALRKA